MIVKNKNGIIIGFILILIIGIAMFFWLRNTNESKEPKNPEENTTNYTANKSATNVSPTNSTNQTEITQSAPSIVGIEEEISSFSTKIYTKEAERQHNIEITCNTLNDTILQPGTTFSFCQTVGQATSAKGYQEADIFDHNGQKKKGLRWW